MIPNTIHICVAFKSHTLSYFQQAHSERIEFWLRPRQHQPLTLLGSMLVWMWSMLKAHHYCADSCSLDDRRKLQNRTQASSLLAHFGMVVFL